MGPCPMLPLRDHPELQSRAADWFAQKWGIPVEEYRESIRLCQAQKQGVPQWYLVLDGTGAPIAGAGVIENDFHRRPDLRPNLCALYVEPGFRGQGLARALLDQIRQDLAAMGEARLYLVTDHTDFYERCGWEFLTLVQDDDGGWERMYTAPTGPVHK